MSTSYKKDLWDRWLKDEDSEAANELVKQYKYLISYHVERVSVHLPKSVQKDELISFAYLGLFDALKKFDPSRDLKFDTYASFRIRGSIIDGLRREDWLPRTLREQTKNVEDTIDRLNKKLERKPTASEVATELGMTTNEVERSIRDSLYSNVLSIDQKSASSSLKDEEQDGYATLVDESMITPTEHILKEEMKVELAKTIKSLNQNEQLVISLFYEKELTMTEIGDVLDLSTSRISQIHKQALFKMHNILKRLYD